MSRTILVTGSEGLLGYALRRMFERLEIGRVVFTTHSQCDLRDPVATKRLFEEVRPSDVLNVAARVGGIGGNMASQASFYLANLKINVNVYEAAQRVGVERMISFMSTCSFPDIGDRTLHEHYLHTGEPTPTNIGYGHGKRVVDVLTKTFRDQWACQYATLSPTNMYGQNDNFNLETGHVIAAMIHKCHVAKHTGTPLMVWGTGAPLREFIYADDVAKVAIWALENYTDPETVIVSPDEEVSIRDLVTMIKREMEYSGDIQFDTSRPDGQFRKTSDSSKLRSLYPEVSFTPIDEGIHLTVKWFRENYPRIRK